MSSRVRLLLGLVLLATAILWTGDNQQSKLRDQRFNGHPTKEMLDLTSNLPKVKDGKVSGIFKGLSDAWPDGTDTRLKVQYMIANTGKAVVGQSLVGKYPTLGTEIAKSMTKVIGPQDRDGQLNQVQIKRLRSLLYAVAWRTFPDTKDSVAVFDNTYRKTVQYLKSLDGGGADEDEDTPVECTCNGTGYITHGDGHKTPCPCDNCQCGTSSELAAVEPEQHVCQCVEPGYDCACFDKYGKCYCPPLKEEQECETTTADSSNSES